MMNYLAEGLRNVGILITPFMPNTSTAIKKQLGAGEGIYTYDSIGGSFESRAAGLRVEKGEALFPRIDVKKELAELEAEAAKKKAAAEEKGSEQITIEEFDRVSLKTARVVAAEEVKRAKKLLKLTVKCGDEKRTIVSGIKESFSAEDMVGKNVVIVANLKPAKLCGIESQGMILAVGGGDGISLVTTETPTEDGQDVR